MTSRRPRVLLGVTGSVAAHRALDLVSELTKSGVEVDVLLSPGAQQFIRPLAFQALSRRKVFTDLFETPTDETHDHLRLALAADVFVVAPCSADALAKFACGLCDDVVSTAMVVFHHGPRLVCPAMNWRMWANPVVRRNVATLEADGFELVPPDDGDLACGERGPGRLAPVPRILERIRARLPAS